MIELGSTTPFSALHLTFLERLVTTIGVALATIQAGRRTEQLLSQSQRLTTELQDQSAELQRTNAELEEKALQLSEQNRNVETQEHGDRRGAAWCRGEGAAAHAGQPVQVGVPGQHEPRAPHSAQLAAVAVPAARRQPGLHPDPEADRVRQHDPRIRAGSAAPDRGHPRPLQDRGGPGGHRARPGGARRRVRRRGAGLRRAGRGQGPRTARRGGSGVARTRSRPTPSGCSRSCAISWPTPSSSPTPAASRCRSAWRHAARSTGCPRSTPRTR